MIAQVVIVGGGFGGLAAAKRLSENDARAQLRVTLVDRTNHHTFQPLLYQVATAGLSPQDVAHSLRGVLARRDNVRVRRASVRAIDPEARRVELDDGTALAYDYLVLAPGAVTAHFGVPGVAEHAHPLKSVGEAVALRNHIVEQLELASAEEEPEPGRTTFVVAGGGPTGVELAGALVELTHTLLRRDFQELGIDRARVVLVERVDCLLSAFSEDARRYTLETLERMGVEVRLGTAITEARADRVVLDDGSSIPTSTLVWAAGVRPHPLVASLDAQPGPGGRLRVAPDLRVPAHSDVFAIGDVAAVEGPNGQPLPQLAPIAMQQGRHAGEQIVRLLQGRPTRAFRYRDRGLMATIGRHAAVVELPHGIRFRGFLAWFAWLALHLLYLVGFRNRLSALLSWAWSYLTYERTLGVVFSPQAVAAASDPEPPARPPDRGDEAVAGPALSQALVSSSASSSAMKARSAA